MCEHKCNVGGKYVLPQAEAFGLSWFIATDGLADIHSCSQGRTEMKKTLIATGWQSSPDPKSNQTVVEAQIVVPAQGLV